MDKPIYLDNNATTPLDPRVLEAMMPVLTEHYGNAASRNHPFGWKAEAFVDDARETIAKAINARGGKEIVFTSGATESDNLALIGVAEMYEEQGKHIITMTTEHKAVIDTARWLEARGWDVTYLNPKPDGLVDLEELKSAIREDTVLVSIMYANNEIGVIQPVEEIGKITREAGVLFHCDAVQAVGKVPVDVQACNIDLMSISGHKIYGPKGVGALYVRKRKPRVRLTEQMHGGGHERGMRSGTLNVPGIVGMAKAIELALEEMDEERKRIRGLRDRLLEGLNANIQEIYVNGSMESRLDGNLNVSFAFVEGESLLMGINDEIAVSSGSACTSASLEPSYVLKALGVGDELAHTSIRFGIGRFTTAEQIEYVIEKFSGVVNRLRELSPLWEMHQEGIDLKSVQWSGH